MLEAFGLVENTTGLAVSVVLQPARGTGGDPGYAGFPEVFGVQGCQVRDEEVREGTVSDGICRGDIENLEHWIVGETRLSRGFVNSHHGKVKSRRLHPKGHCV